MAAKYVKSTVKLNHQKIAQLTKAATVALEMTAEKLHTDVVQAEIMPRDSGAMQNEQTFVDFSESSRGKVQLVSSTPYARRLYYHPEYNFKRYENAFAQGEWFKPWLKGGLYAGDMQKNFSKFYKRLMR